jgi:hypothetical protein
MNVKAIQTSVNNEKRQGCDGQSEVSKKEEKL